MSYNPWHLYAEGLAVRLRATVPACSPALAENERVDVVVFREDDLLSLAASHTSKASGQAVIITGAGGRNPDPNANELRMGAVLGISVWSSQVLSGDTKADDLIWQCASAAHGFVLEDGPNERTRRFEVSEVVPVPRGDIPGYIVWEATGEVKRLPLGDVTLPSPVVWESIGSRWDDL